LTERIAKTINAVKSGSPKKSTTGSLKRKSISYKKEQENRMPNLTMIRLAED
jgi:hypothetical protein